jgi:cobalt-precorrin-5B (C1)-methyltransferase
MNDLREPELPRTMRQRGGKALRPGWTTGSCASAAAKAAALALASGDPQHEVEIAIPGRDGAWTRRVGFAVARCDFPAPGRAEAVVVKDAGDDPDVTDGARLTATVSWRAEPGLEIDGGVGVGVVTKPGLGLEVGGPAINPVPRAMIRRAVGEAVDLEARGVRVVISVPDGEIMARKTTNRRLGILGGISILGTTGIVRPFSTAAWRASVEQAVSVLAAQAAAVGDPARPATLVLCTGGRTEKGAMALLPHLPEVSFVEVGDFTGAALRRCVEHGVREVVFVGMAGKLTKLAAGVLMTHYTRSAVDTDVLAEITTRAIPHDPALAARVREANTARHVYELWDAAGALAACGDALCGQVAQVLERFARTECGGAVRARVGLVDFGGERLVGRSDGWRDCGDARHV